MSFEKYILPIDDGPKMPIHAFVAILSEYMLGSKTGAEARTAIESLLGVTLSANETSDITSVIAYIDGGNNATVKRNRMDELYRVLVLAEHGVWYNTQELLKVKMNWL